MTRTIKHLMFAITSYLLLSGAATALQDSSGMPRRGLHDIAQIQVILGNRQFDFLIDTGADKTTVNECILRELDLACVGTVRLQTPHELATFNEHEATELRIAGGASKMLRPVSLDIRNVFGGFYMPFDGILGYDYFQNGVVEIANGEVRMHTTMPANFEQPEDFLPRDKPADVLKLDIDVPNFGGGKIRIDTGCTGELRFREGVIKSLQSQNLCVEGARVESITASSRRSGTSYVLREILVAGVRFRNVPVSVAADNAIGLGLLRHLNLALDFPNQRICVGRPPRAEIDHFSLNATGMAVAFDESERLTVRILREDSPATKAGIEVGDEVVVINGTDVEALTIDDVTELFAQDGKTIQIQLRRGMDVRTVELALKLPFEYPPNWEAMDAKVEGFEKFLEAEEKASKSGSK